MAAVIDPELRKAEDEGWHELHALIDSLLQPLGIGDEQIVADQLDLISQLFAHQ